MNKPYTKEEMLVAVANSKCFSDVFRELGLKINGGSYSWMKRTIAKYSLDTSHFLSGGDLLSHVNQKKRSKVYKIESPRRVRAQTLRSLLVAHGASLNCNDCGLNDWKGKPIILDVDHIDENCLNNSVENLQFLCPNCHRQKTQS